MKLKYNITALFVAIAALLSFSSCESYLDKTDDSIVAEGEAYKNFTNFQGFVEEIYNCIPDKLKSAYVTSWNWGDDEIMNPGQDALQCNQFDLGNFWNWQHLNGGFSSWMDKSNADPSWTTDGFKHDLWSHAWYCIRKTNLGIENIGLMTDATEEERNIILGQLHFFRAWWHLEMMMYFGGLPYIDRVLPANEPFREPRLSFQEAASKAADDFSLAAEYLPMNWDKTTAGLNTVGHNEMRITKAAALGYKGKAYLWAASPLMEHGQEIGGANTYNYNQDYCKAAAEAFGELITLVESGETQFALHNFDYSDIYNHTANKGVTNTYTENCYTINRQFYQPGGTEALMRNISLKPNASNWNCSKTFGPKINGLIIGTVSIHQPTANLVNQYGMANGLPLNDPDSGFDPEYPFKNRDPRFYHDIVFDGFKYVNAAMKASDEFLRYCSLYTGGKMRNETNASRTGYFIQKIAPHTANKYDLAYTESSGLHIAVAYMRLADVYLMYAEAGAALPEGRNYKSSNCSLTSADALNVIRRRVGAGDVATKFTGNEYMDEVRRERTVELAFEGFRFTDLNRWLLTTEAPYTTKTSQEFDRVESDDWYKTNNPADARVANWREEPIITRQFTAKHYWLPLKVKDVSMYPEFYQNLGW